MNSHLDLDRFATVQLVPLTPFSADGQRVLADRLGPFVKEMYGAGIRVFLPAAGTGEFHSLTADEILACVAATRTAVGGDTQVVAPIGLGLPFALQVGRRAIEAGADALLVMPPVHSYLCDAGVREYFMALARELPRPLLAYKKGPFPSDELLLELARGGQLAGIKYAVNDVDAVARFAAALDKRVGLYCGTAERFAPSFMLAGARGYTSGAGNICPRLTLAMHRALANGDYSEAGRILAIIRPIEDYRARAADSYNISMLKFALQVAGHDFGPVRPPLRKLTAQEETEIRALVQPILAAEAELA
jgi:4-hydroxy-tetrahydrodipicolinate synthase